ncbi:SDR family NAD(P)-dependent oxidoreductase [Bosea sp. (in: a-proteobacteria)]|uniref:SDR family NAD(P)-dependent oxidoreductase n=1 Tax=Bosea sp. (in: a-proteobacteria) TaxID=1871050 RepID=UPI002610D893|nr:SDR family NAD(P)-dependent oxidoreductase [Bosea sp. (in: a-proteobacteria)]MCO5090937.1 SDR family oxidoreductase [Bosea sp. (in: a-proteobacteria)]
MTDLAEGCLAGRVALITGASGGIGGAVARVFAKQGASLSLADLAAPEIASARIARPSGRLIALAADITKASDVEMLVERTISEFGRLDILVNGAGVVSFGSAETLSEAEWDRVLAVNLKGTFLTCQAVVPHMRRAGYGRIVNLGSVVGKNGGNARAWVDRREQSKAGNIAYGVSKAGVHAMTVFLARELAADGITVNAVAPGPIASDMTTSFPASLKALIPVGRLGEASEVAEAVLFLAKESSAFITAEVLDINGGIWGD